MDTKVIRQNTCLGKQRAKEKLSTHHKCLNDYCNKIYYYRFLEINKTKIAVRHFNIEIYFNYVLTIYIILTLNKDYSFINRQVFALKQSAFNFQLRFIYSLIIP